LLLTGRPSPMPSADSAGPSVIGPSSGTPPTQPTGGPTAQETPFVKWERIDLPDQAPDVLGGGVPHDVVAFGDGYVAVGSFEATCVSDIVEAPPNCAEELAALPAGKAAMVWLSPDGRQWEEVPYRAAFESGSMSHAATDGRRIVVTGRLGERAVVWTSDDGRAWDLVDTGILVPEQIASTSSGFVGARATDQGPQFLASDDGRSWRSLSAAGELGPGEVFGVAVGRDRGTVIAFGAIYDYAGEELASITAASWLSRDGRSWTMAPHHGPDFNGAWMSAAAEAETGWAAVGNDQASARSTDTAAWTSPDGLNWTRSPASTSPVSEYGSADQLVWAQDYLVATGTIGGEGGSVAAAWVSEDGSSWTEVPRQPALTEGTPVRLIPAESGVLAVGVRQSTPDHWVGVAWVASR